MNFAAIVLAAGLSRRMGAPKQFLNIAGKPMILYSVDAAINSGLSPVVVVAGAYPEKTRHLLDNRPVQLVANPDYKTGLSSSLRAGVGFVLNSPNLSTLDGAAVLLADQPFQTPGLIAQLVTRYQDMSSDGTRIVRPEFHGVQGNPVLFARDFLPLLLHTTGDKGARDLISQHGSELSIVRVNEPYQGMDIDTRSDLQKARQIVQQPDQTQQYWRGESE